MTKFLAYLDGLALIEVSIRGRLRITAKARCDHIILANSLTAEYRFVGVAEIASDSTSLCVIGRDTCTQPFA